MLWKSRTQWGGGRRDTLDDNAHNIVYFENDSMKGLFDVMDTWQLENEKRFLSVSIQRDDEKLCCIALTNPMEVVIADKDGESQAEVEVLGVVCMVRSLPG